MKQALCSFLMAVAMTWALPAQAFRGISSKKKVEVKSHKVAVIKIYGAYPDYDDSVSFFAEKKTYAKLLRRIKRAKNDSYVKAVVFRFGGVSMGLAKASELRKAIAGLGAAGKKTYATLDTASTPGYIAASGCQKLIMSPGGMLFLPGLRSEMLYFKKMMDRFGLVGDFVTVGDFKTAPEPYLRESMSESQRKQVTALLTDLYGQMVETIAKSRKIKQEVVKKAIDQALLTPQQAKKMGLIDSIAYLSSLRDTVNKDINVRPLKFVKNYAKRKKKKPTSLWSMMSMIWSSKKPKVKNTKPKIAVIYASGSIMYGSKPSGTFSNNKGIYSSNMLKTLNKVAKLKNLKAIVLRVNSPGGSALASDLIWKRLEQLKKKYPLFVSMGNVAASGGYYISMGADLLVAEPSTITGSIGVFGGKVVFGKTLNKLGVNVQSVSIGKNSGIFSPFKTFNKTERAILQKMLNEVYVDFVTKGAKGRKMTYKKMVALAGGRVWTGRQAKKNGLVDKLGSLQDTIQWAKKRTGLKGKVQLITYPRPKGFFEALRGISSAQDKALPYAKGALWKVAMQLHPHLRQALLPLMHDKKQILMWTPVPRIVLK